MQYSIMMVVRPSFLRTTRLPSIMVNIEYEIDEDAYSPGELAGAYGTLEEGIAAEGYMIGASYIVIEDNDEHIELDLGIDMGSYEELPQELEGAFREYAENLDYCDSHIDEYDGMEDAIVAELSFQYDSQLVESACQELFGMEATEVPRSTLRELGEDGAWEIESATAIRSGSVR